MGIFNKGQVVKAGRVRYMLSGVLYRKVSPLVQWKVSGRDGSHTGEVVLCWGLFEQVGHGHISDEYEKTIYYCSIAGARILSLQVNTFNYRTNQKGGRTCGQTMIFQHVQ